MCVWFCWHCCYPTLLNISVFVINCFHNLIMWDQYIKLSISICYTMFSYRYMYLFCAWVMMFPYYYFNSFVLKSWYRVEYKTMVCFRCYFLQLINVGYSVPINHVGVYKAPHRLPLLWHRVFTQIRRQVWTYVAI